MVVTYVWSYRVPALEQPDFADWSLSQAVSMRKGLIKGNPSGLVSGTFFPHRFATKSAFLVIGYCLRSIS